MSEIKTIDIKSDHPTVTTALDRLDAAIVLARDEKQKLLKIIHGYGSTGAGGDIRVAVQKRLFELKKAGRVREYIFGENWARSDETTWKLLQAHPKIKSDSDLGRRNQGISIVQL